MRVRVGNVGKGGINTSYPRKTPITFRLPFSWTKSRLSRYCCWKGRGLVSGERREEERGRGGRGVSYLLELGLGLRHRRF